MDGNSKVHLHQATAIFDTEGKRQNAMARRET